jgi:hypothetical protein
MTLVSALALTSCSNDPAPSADSQHNYGATHFAVSKAGDPFEVDGCLVSVHRITTASSDLLPDFTLATAKCPTATVTAVNNGCGKSCVANNIVVTPAAQPLFDTQNASAEAATRTAADATQAEATAEFLAERQAVARAARIRTLHAEVDRLDRELQQLEHAPE